MSSNQNPLLSLKTNVFFYQQRGHLRHIKRFKKQPDQIPVSLRGFLNAKAPTNSRNKNRFRIDSAGGNNNEEEEEEISLSSKLTDLAAQAQLNLDTQRMNGKINMSNKMSIISLVNPFDFTDHRVHVIKQISELMIIQLQEYLNRFDNVKMSPVLVGPVVYKMHADWSDLTEDCTYDKSPQWHTRISYELVVRQKTDLKSMDSIKKQIINTSLNTSLTQPNQLNYLGLDSTTHTIATATPATPMRSMTLYQMKKPKKLQSIGLSKHKEETNKQLVSQQEADANQIINQVQDANRVTTTAAGGSGILFSLGGAGETKVTTSLQFQRKATTFKGSSTATALIAAGSMSSAIPIIASAAPMIATSVPNLQGTVQQSTPYAQPSQPTPVSQSVLDYRQTGMTTALGGWIINFQLSNSKFEQRGWVSVTEKVNNTHPVDFERRALRALQKSYRSMDENKIKNERLGLTKPSKIRYYGDRKKEQLEKYKNLNIRPKKSAFAMSILRKEIPKPLDVETVIENLYAPKTTNGNESPLGEEAFGGLKQHTLCSTHTNDGTTCVFYPSGRIAILTANVFGYFLDHSTSNTNNANNNTSNVNTSNNNGINNSNLSLNTAHHGPGGGGAGTANTSLSSISTSSAVNWCSLKDSFTTIVFDDKKANMNSASSSTFNSGSSSNFKTSKSRVHADGAILAMISANGSCVVYRKNGTVKFICNESGGCFCDEKGGLNYQWKWHEIKTKDVDFIKKNLKKDSDVGLFLKLNEFVRLEYENPFNITLKFDCMKEIIEFNLGCQRDNLSRLHEYLHKTSSDIPLQSKSSIVKTVVKPTGKSTAVIPTSKQPPQLQTQHTQIITQSMTRRALKETNEAKLLEKLYDTTICYRDIPALKDLLVIQRRIRSVFDDWLQYCRTILSMLEPTIYILPEFLDSRNLNENHIHFNKITVFKRKSKSAEFDRNFIKKLTKVTKARVTPTLHKRARSTLSGRNRSLSNKHKKYLTMSFNDWKRELTASAAVPQPIKRQSSPKLKVRVTTAPRPEPVKQVLHTISSSPEERLSRMETPSRQDHSPKRAKSYQKEDLATMNDQCPVALRYRLLLDRRTECKCKKNSVPVITDIELDKFLKVTPPDQLILVAIINSSDTTPNGNENLVQQLFEEYNKNRFRPCVMSSRDDIRLFFYDTKSATNDPNEPSALLVQRHNVMPGMALIYQNSRLVFCDHIFNGYGNSLSDFMKQLHQTKLDAKAGKFLPNNFRFQRPKGNQGNRTAWGGEIGGLIVLTADSNGSKRLTDTLSTISPIPKLATLQKDSPGPNSQRPQLVVLPRIKVTSSH